MGKCVYLHHLRRGICGRVHDVCCCHQSMQGCHTMAIGYVDVCSVTYQLLYDVGVALYDGNMKGSLV